MFYKVVFDGYCFFSFFISYFFLLFIYNLQLVRHPVAGVITCYIITDYDDLPLKFISALSDLFKDVVCLGQSFFQLN